MFKRRTFFSVAMLALAALPLSALSGCNSATSTQVTTDISAALAFGCPVIAAIQAQKPALSNAQAAGLQALVNVCPPNPAPTSISVAATVLIADANLLLPLLPKAQAAELRVRMQRIEIDLGRLPK